MTRLYTRRAYAGKPRGHAAPRLKCEGDGGHGVVRVVVLTAWHFHHPIREAFDEVAVVGDDEGGAVE